MINSIVGFGRNPRHLENAVLIKPNHIHMDEKKGLNWKGNIFITRQVCYLALFWSCWWCVSSNTSSESSEDIQKLHMCRLHMCNIWGFIPKSLQGALWSSGLSRFDLHKQDIWSAQKSEGDTKYLQALLFSCGSDGSSPASRTLGNVILMNNCCNMDLRTKA